ncbi:MAG: phenylalanine--tRNA ligase subunit beta [Bdellovibrionales bacterium RIFOXYB1_FULL_37_110]|nr:MAG: phenylalanine--tRNA ligase subunit beta [Bdellovibrionales bacterium RIFOXYA1_FULL_38_20]OFZ48574.1 MAG: phenylalanine--tRNA ligase subunit beta [Bdellovibrionales bacterium RIFOXYC1_FULL_37_79]OFZ58383.1 MAG: phenylalanine--tRNA ligase subunit beta [Bdellovibrionales bacterium RIFOXYB1_FULL_37_110]OFZ62528.1 MAG: phenylalanine--tRNA ligase subunit beta [Bdellovibrionales bacterium RIFOXYD1_FULL_36_51]
MLISIGWIKEFVELPKLSKEEIKKRFTLATAEVEEVKETGPHLKQIIIAQIKEIKKHPEADKLNLVTFTTGKENKTVVCGASNVKVGLKIPYAPLGTTFPDGFTLVPKQIRGIMSEGMLCSEKELGLSESSSGLMELANEAPLGKSMSEYLNLSPDVLLDIDNKSITHRPDLWGHFGMAREFSAVYNLALKNPFDHKWEDKLRKNFTSAKSPIVPRIEGECAGLGYYGLSLDGVVIGDSPDWMKSRLTACGLRPINNVVDISNYVMLELGMPLHIFDREMIKDQLIIKQLGKETEFITLDEEKRNLIKTDTVICDSTGPLVLAGIMGGQKSGVTNKTSKIFVEVANWKSAPIRKTSSRLGLRTDSSQRYEKSLDSALLERTMFRTLELILQICPMAKVIGKLEYAGENWKEKKPLKIKTTVAKINMVLGTEIKKEKIIQIFESLSFKVHGLDGDNLEVEVPSFRSTKDIEYEADIIEEIGRIIGYDNIAESSPHLEIKPVNLSSAMRLDRKIKDFMVYKGNSFEVMTYPMVGKSFLDKASWTTPAITVINAMSEDCALMRPSLIPSLLDAAAKNQKNFEAFKFFEIGRSYLKDSKNFSKESNHLGVVFYHKTDNVFLDLANTVEKLMSDIKVPFVMEQKGQFKSELLLNETWLGCHPFEFLNVRIMGKMNGVITSVHPLVLRNYKMKGNLSMAIIDLSSFEDKSDRGNIKYKPIEKFPSSTFDWTLLAGKNIFVGEILACFKKINIKELVSIRVVDVYNISAEQKTVTLRATFNNPDKTLDGDFLEKSKNQLIEVAGQAGFVLKM